MARLWFSRYPRHPLPTPHPPPPFCETVKPMADFERSPQSSHRGYKPHRDRTSDWVNRLPPKHAAHFVDPAMAPSDTESAIYSSDSDGESTHSVPPRFVLRFPDGREERVSDGYHPGPNTSLRDVRSRATSGPVNYGPPSHHHHSRSVSMHPSGGYPGVPFRPHSSNANVRHQEQIRILPQRSMTPASAGYINSRPVPVHRPRSSSIVAPNPRRAYEHGSPNSSDHSDEWVTKYGPPEAIKFSHSHPPSKYDGPTRDYSASGYRPHSSSRLRGQSVVGSPSSHMSQLTKVNTIANSHSRAMSRGGIIEDNWSVIDEDEEWEKEQRRAAQRRGRTSSQSSGSPPLTFSRSRTNSSSSRSGYYPSGPGRSGPEKSGPPPASSTGAGSMKRPFFSRWFGSGHDKNVPAPPPQSHNRLRRHSIGGSRR